MRTTRGVELSWIECRRNLVTRGVPLNDLLGVRFQVGPVSLEGVRLCHPCAYLSRLTGQPDLLPPFMNRGGLRARIVNPGMLCVGDRIRPMERVPDSGAPSLLVMQ